MIKILRKHRNWLMIVIAILALPFCIYFVKSDPGLIRSDAFAHDQLCLKRIKQVVASGVSLPESESKSNYEQLYGKNFVSVVRVRSTDFLKEIKPTDDDIQKYYEAHKGELKTDEKRKVEFVR